MESQKTNDPKYRFDKAKLQDALAKVQKGMRDVWDLLKLTPSQGITFFRTEPNVHRLMAIKELTHVDPLDLVIVAPEKRKAA